MLKLIIKKLLQGILMVLAVSAITFAMLSAAGGDALSSVRDNPQVSEKTVAELTRFYGLGRPLPARYSSWLVSAAGGDLGESFTFRVPVTTVILSRLANTALLGITALAIAAIVAFLIAMLNIRSPNRVLSTSTEALILLTASTPRMVMALVALLLALWAAVPTYGGVGLTQLAIASVVLALPLISIFLAQLRDGLDAAMNEDFVRLARAKGLSENMVIGRHALRSALNPFLTIVGLSFGGLLGGSVIVETVLGWPGIGALMVSAVRSRDIPLVMGIVLASSVAVWAGNTAAEFLQVLNDPRLRSNDEDLS